ncbi:uncharacterized protein ANIA_11074 [Aspergillus nidulans FGSC A4]|uniref:Uncharacterized protein n=1 Tax=Emericella nidulans (strain FGSC A4 / ATCC 38163 / CBS 112.46 / NRRL 194 / M139) TaxID=227321 RepID=C8VE17_EMENI|nr:hypothetical protein [Aspergillus nidulans FGSC A4]CBF80312.1 TPA: hypothetical protein ANIA_11074 [Aspergillus nidulans FGSC A4]
MQQHLEKHSIFAPYSQAKASVRSGQPSIMSFITKQESLSHQEHLEKNILCWIIRDKQAFITIKLPEFQQIFQDTPGIILPFSSQATLRRRLIDNFEIQRLQLKEELKITCKSIALSLDIWTSQNHLPILGIIGHWLMEDFIYQEKVLEFTELHGVYSRENLAAAVQLTLSELDLEEKLIIITGDNASNNKTMASELYYTLKGNIGESSILQFQGLDSYIRCLAYILNLVVKDILRALKSGSSEEAYAACISLCNGQPISTQSALAKL